MAQFWWVVYPYICLMIMIVGSLYRFTYRQIAWGSKSSQMLEQASLKWGSRLFHWGIIFVFFGHVMGLVIPMWVYADLGVTPEFYHLNAIIFGGVIGILCWLGAGILLIRRSFNLRVRANSHFSDFLTLDVLMVVLTLGLAVTLIYDVFDQRYEYRATIGPWFRELLTLHPDASLMTKVPLIFQLHIIAAFALFAMSPFTRLVHIWSYPLHYVGRSPIQYRSRARYRHSPAK